MANRRERNEGYERDSGAEDAPDTSRYARENYSSPAPHKGRPTKRGAREPDTEDWERVLTPYDNRRKTEPRNPASRRPPASPKEPDHTMVMPEEAAGRVYGEPRSNLGEDARRKEIVARDEHKKRKRQATRNIKWSYLVGIALIGLLLITFVVKQG